LGISYVAKIGGFGYTTDAGSYGGEEASSCDGHPKGDGTGLVSINE